MTATSELQFLIWSRAWNLWWRPKRAGYTENIDEAGRYSFVEASDITSANNWRCGMRRRKSKSDVVKMAPESKAALDAACSANPKPPAAARKE